MDDPKTSHDNAIDTLTQKLSDARAQISNPKTVGHPFLLLRRNLSSFFTVAELRSLCRRLGHPKAGKLNSLLRRPQSAEVT